MTTYTIETEDATVLKAVDALLKGFRVPFKQKVDKTYNPDFVAKIEKSRRQAKEGETVKIELDDIWK